MRFGSPAGSPDTVQACNRPLQVTRDVKPVVRQQPPVKALARPEATAGRHLRTRSGNGNGDGAPARRRRPAKVLLATSSAIGAAALVTVLVAATLGEAGRPPSAPAPTFTTGSALLDAPPSTRPTPTTVPLMRGSPRVNQIEAFSAYPDGIQVQIEEAEHWPAPGGVRMHLVKALVRIRNRSGRSFDPGQAAVTTRYGRKRTTARLVEPGRFAGSIAPGAQRFAQWLFAVPATEIDDLEIEVTAGRGRQPLLFRGHADEP